jgi:hypothetical protein
MDRRELSAGSWFSSRAVVALLVLAGAYLILQPEWLGWNALVKALGSETKLVAVAAGIAFFLLAAQSWEKHQIRVQAAETMEALHQLLYGKDYRRDREAIEILLTALETGSPDNSKSAYEHLKRLTGQNFAADPKVWRTWWEANKRSFEKARSAPESPPK